MKNMDKEERGKFIRIIVSAVFFVVLIIIQHTVDVNHWLMLGLYAALL